MRRSPVVAALTKPVLRRAAAVICVSAYVARLLAAPDDVTVEVIDCGVDTERLKPAPRARDANGNGPRFLFVGSLTPRKNLERLLLAFGKLGGGTLTIVGGGPLEERLRATAPVGTRFAGRLDVRRRRRRDREGGRRLPAEPRGAAGPGDARGARARAAGGGDPGRRAGRGADPAHRRARRPARRRLDRRRHGRRGGAAGAVPRGGARWRRSTRCPLQAERIEAVLARAANGAGRPSVEPKAGTVPAPGQSPFRPVARILGTGFRAPLSCRHDRVAGAGSGVRRCRRRRRGLRSSAAAGGRSRSCPIACRRRRSASTGFRRRAHSCSSRRPTRPRRACR